LLAPLRGDYYFVEVPTEGSCAVASYSRTETGMARDDGAITVSQELNNQ
jgi:hypothetical protein